MARAIHDRLTSLLRLSGRTAPPIIGFFMKEYFDIDERPLPPRGTVRPLSICAFGAESCSRHSTPDVRAREALSQSVPPR